jgi:hypothetical protein
MQHQISQMGHFLLRLASNDSRHELSAIRQRQGAVHQSQDGEDGWFVPAAKVASPKMSHTMVGISSRYQPLWPWTRWLLLPLS